MSRELGLEYEPPAEAPTDYAGDYYRWTMHQAAVLRSGQFAALDREHLAEEVEDLGKSEQRALESDLTIIIQHMLKWSYQPERRSRSWELSLREHRRRVHRLLKRSPSLAARLDEAISETYADGRDRALSETGLEDAQIPQHCPYFPAQILGETSDAGC